MIVGAALIEIHVHGSQSLKEKRGVVRSMLQRIRNRFNVSAAEVDGQDTWQRATLGVVSVGRDARELRAVLDRVVAFAESTGLAEVTNSDVEILNLEHADLADRSDDGSEDDPDLDGGPDDDPCGVSTSPRRSRGGPS
ncbi:hypothetical protein MYXO_01875 [Myxococcaceae bacterium]|jgi:uncharacterized protein YlxP (DUF503 family)|nr:hypothetical protein MYXO_01875 [Myxococcaceae bacterium]